MPDRKEYIERGALIVTIQKDPWIGAQGKDYALSDIAEQPAADVVEVVRCKNCTFSTSLPLSDVVHGDYVLCCSGEKVPKNGFCNYGVRKDGAGDD